MSDSLLILVCDHRGEGLGETLRPLASVGFRLEESASLGETRLRLRSVHPDVILLDPLARGGALELEQIEEDGQHVPILLVAEPQDPLPTLAATRVLVETPCDVIYRDAPLEEYLMRLERLRGQSEGRRELDEMRFQAVHDDRTELLRPAPFQARLREHFSAAGRHRFEMALVLLDLDRFGRINKDYDHTVGDAVITRVGRVIREFLRAEDIGGRLGGDEFALVLPYTRKVDAARVVNRIRDQIAGLTGPGEDGEEIVISASIGFETYDGSDLESVETMRRHAEVALRRAKLAGGNKGLYFRSLEDKSGAEERA